MGGMQKCKFYHNGMHFHGKINSDTIFWRFCQFIFPGDELQDILLKSSGQGGNTRKGEKLNFRRIHWDLEDRKIYTFPKKAIKIAIITSKPEGIMRVANTVELKNKTK